LTYDLLDERGNEMWPRVSTPGRTVSFLSAGNELLAVARRVLNCPDLETSDPVLLPTDKVKSPRFRAAGHYCQQPSIARTVR